MWHTLGPGVSFSAAKRLCRVLGTELYDKEASRASSRICFSDTIRIMRLNFYITSNVNTFPAYIYSLCSIYNAGPLKPDNCLQKVQVNRFGAYFHNLLLIRFKYLNLLQ